MSIQYTYVFINHNEKNYFFSKNKNNNLVQFSKIMKEFNNK